MKEQPQTDTSLARIRESIARAGYHVYVVSGGPVPRFAYTIGARDLVGRELLLAGAVYYLKNEVLDIIKEAVDRLRDQKQETAFKLGELGTFSFRHLHKSWTRLLLLGAFDYYKTTDIDALQIVPDESHWTIDVPDTGEPWSATTAPVWRWLGEQWNYPVSDQSTVATNLAALQGARVTEAMRWERDEWEIFAGAGPEVSKEEMRVVPLGTLIASDNSLSPVVRLAIGEGLWRDSAAGSEWHQWKRLVDPSR